MKSMINKNKSEYYFMNSTRNARVEIEISEVHCAPCKRLFFHVIFVSENNSHL